MNGFQGNLSLSPWETQVGGWQVCCTVFTNALLGRTIINIIIYNIIIIIYMNLNLQ